MSRPVTINIYLFLILKYVKIIKRFHNKRCIIQKAEQISHVPRSGKRRPEVAKNIENKTSIDRKMATRTTIDRKNVHKSTDCAIRREVGHRVIVSCFEQRNMIYKFVINIYDKKIALFLVFCL